VSWLELLSAPLKVEAQGVHVTLALKESILDVEHIQQQLQQIDAALQQVRGREVCGAVCRSCAWAWAASLVPHTPRLHTLFAHRACPPYVNLQHTLA
jgi:hypothetical protein